MPEEAPSEEEAARKWLDESPLNAVLTALLEAVCMHKPDKFFNFSIGWVREEYPAEAAGAAAAADASGEWKSREEVDATPNGLMEYLKEIDATTTLESITEMAIRKQPVNVIAYVVDELVRLRGTGSSEGAAAHTNGNGLAITRSVTADKHPKAGELMEAISEGDVDVLVELLTAGVPPDVKDDNGSKTALMAATEGERECMVKLLEAGANVNLQLRSGETALMLAVKYGDLEIIKLLLDSGADIGKRDIKGATAVDHATDKDVLELLAPLDAAAQTKLDNAFRPAVRRSVAPRRGSVSSESIDPKNRVDLTAIPKVEKPPEVIAFIEKCIEGHLLFSGIDESTRGVLILSMTERTVEAGETVIKQGEDGDFFYIVGSGTFECFVHGHKGDTTPPPGQLVKTYQPKEHFGELALMYNTPRAASVVAKETATLWCVDRETFRRIILSAHLRKRQRFEGILESVPLLVKLSGAERTHLADCFDESTFTVGSEIIKEGDDGTEGSFYILLEGECSATQLDSTQTEHEVMHYTGGSTECYFGELALMRDEKRAATVRAVTECKCILLDKASFERLLGPVKDILAREYAAHI